MIEFERYGDCIVQVGMLGEGYDHPPLSIAAVFRPFRTLSAYIQFVGRTLRSINNAPNPALDNIAEIVTHVGLNQQGNWQDFTRFDELDWSKFVDIGDSSEGREEGASERIRRVRQEMVVHGEEGVSFDTTGYQPDFIDAYREAIQQFLQKEMKPRAEELGIDLEGIEYLLEEFGELPDFSEQEVQRIPIRPDRARNQLKKILNARVRGAGAHILVELGFEFQGRDLIDIVGDGDERNNVQVVMRLLNRAVNEAIGIDSGQRRECNKEQYEEALKALPDIENNILELLQSKLM